MKWAVPILLFGFTAVAAPETAPSPDFSLKDAIAKALLQSPKMVQAREDQRAADAAVSKQRSAFFPSLKAEFKAGTYHDRIPNPGEMQIPRIARDRNQYIGQLLIDQPLFQGFGTLAEISVAKSKHRQATAQLVETANDTAMEVIQTYFGMKLMEAQLKAERETMGLLQKQLQQVRSRTAQGRGTELQLLQAEYAVQAKIPVIQDLEMDWDLKKLRLSALTGETFAQEVHLSDELEAANRVLDDSQLPKLNEAIQAMLKGNASLTKLDAQIEEGRSQAGIKSSKHFPSLGLTLAAGTNAFQRTDIATSDALVYSGELKLVIPLFSGLSSVHESNESTALLTSMHKKYEAERSLMVEKITRAYREWETANLRIEAEKKNVQITKRAIRQAENLFSVGRVTLTEVLNTYSDGLSATRALEDAIYRRVDAIARIRSLTGSLVPAQVTES